MANCSVCEVPDGIWHQRRLGTTEWRRVEGPMLGREGWSISVPSLVWVNRNLKWPPLCQSCLRARMDHERKQRTAHPPR